MATIGKTIRGKCPRCCPDGGAVFTVEMDWDAIDRGENTSRKVKRCNNCHLSLSMRQVKATGQPTPSQWRIIERIKRAFGADSCESMSMIGRKVWFAMVNRDRSMFLGDSLFGTIGVGGSFEITLQRIGGDVKITDEIGIDVYLK